MGRTAHREVTNGETFDKTDKECDVGEKVPVCKKGGGPGRERSVRPPQRAAGVLLRVRTDEGLTVADG